MLKVGLTGGIGSGKSSVARIFELLGVPVFNSDDEARTIMESDERVRTQIIALLGSESYTLEGKPDRKHIADVVFQKDNLLQGLNEIVHPAVRTRFDAWIADFQDIPYVIQETALLFEAGISSHVDETILVWAPEEIRIQRVIARDQTNEKQVRSRMQYQWNDLDKFRGAQHVIINDGAHGLIHQVQELHSTILALIAGPIGDYRVQ